MATDKTYNRFIHTMRWLKLRKDVLSCHPMCQECEKEGRLAFATEVHHIVPCEHAITPSAVEALMFDRNNLLALCHQCHVQKHIELGRAGKAASHRINEARKAEVIKNFFE